MIPDTDRPTVYDWNATCDIGRHRAEKECNHGT